MAADEEDRRAKRAKIDETEAPPLGPPAEERGTAGSPLVMSDTVASFLSEIAGGIAAVLSMDYDSDELALYDLDDARESDKSGLTTLKGLLGEETSAIGAVRYWFDEGKFRDMLDEEELRPALVHALLYLGQMDITARECFQESAFAHEPERADLRTIVDLCREGKARLSWNFLFKNF